MFWLPVAFGHHATFGMLRHVGIGAAKSAIPPGIPPTARAVLDAVDRIPPGKVMSYGDVAEYAGVSSARGVGRVMSRYGHEVAWHRVLRSDGTPAPALADRQLALLRAEGAPVRGGRVDMRLARWSGDGG